MKRTFFTLAVAALIASGSAFAQQSQPSTQPNQPAPTVNDRKQISRTALPTALTLAN